MSSLMTVQNQGVSIWAGLPRFLKSVRRLVTGAPVPTCLLWVHGEAKPSDAFRRAMGCVWVG